MRSHFERSAVFPVALRTHCSFQPPRRRDRRLGALGTFRKQCQRLAEAHAIVILGAFTLPKARPAKARISVSSDGSVVARVDVPLNARTLELVAHELEHVLEQVDGVNLAIQAALSRSLTSPSGVAVRLPGDESRPAARSRRGSESRQSFVQPRHGVGKGAWVPRSEPGLSNAGDLSQRIDDVQPGHRVVPTRENAAHHNTPKNNVSHRWGRTSLGLTAKFTARTSGSQQHVHAVGCRAADGLQYR